MAQTASQEWLNANLSRAYPLADSTGGQPNTLPSSLLVDACILYDCSGLGDEVVIDSAWIHEVTVTDSGLILGITCHATNNTNYIFDELLFVSFGAARNSVIKFISESSGLCVSGSVTVGDATVIGNWPRYTDIDQESSSFSPSVLHDISGLYVTAIKVGDIYLSGEVELVAGDGIEFTVNKETRQLTISNTKYTIPDANVAILDDEQLMTAAVAEFGTPIRTINDVYPDSNGDISITAPAGDDGEDYIKVASVSDAGIITLELKKDPCIDDETIDNLTENLSELNARCARINSSQLALDNAVNNLATQLTRLN